MVSTSVRRNGFTLIECLVVMAIVAVLAGVLLPALAVGRDRGRSVVCQANLKQNAAATLVFVHNERQFPFGFCSSGGFSTAPPGGFVGDAADGRRGWWWFHQISDSKNPGQDVSIYCPSRPQTDTVLYSNYGANYSVYKFGDAGDDPEFFGDPLKAARLSRPGRTLLLVDSGYTLISWKVTLPQSEVSFEIPERLSSFFLPGLAVNASRTIAPPQQTDAVKGRHWNCSVNAAFGDGHVQSLRASQLSAGDAADGAAGTFYRWRP